MTTNVRPTSASPRPPLAIVGVSALFPGRGTTDGLWTDIITGADLIRDVPETHWSLADHFDPDPRTPLDRTYCKRGAFVPPTPFDPMEFGIPPTVLAVTDSTQILALVMAKQVLEDAARHRWPTLDRSRISVILGFSGATDLHGHMASRTAWPHWVSGLRTHGMAEAEIETVCDRIRATFAPWHEMTFPGGLGNVIAGRLANRLDLGGTNATVDAACASALAAIAAAANELTLGHCDLAITGAVDLSSFPGVYIIFSKTPALSPTHDCRPFAANADGTVLGEGVGLFALRRLADAERDNDRIYAVVRGVGLSSDGRATSIYAPRREGQVAALRRAYADAGYAPETVTLIEAHGTGTAVGDAVEVASLREAFGNGNGMRRHTCAIGSIKSQMGHTRGAAGAAGLFKTVMALRHGVLPPTLKVEQPNPALALDDGPFYINSTARPWISGDTHPRRAGLSAFGFGGTNVHVTLEEYVGPGVLSPRLWTPPAELVLVSADSIGTLARRVRDVITRAAESDDLPLVAHDSQQAFRSHDAHRLAVVATSPADLSAKLEPSLAILLRDMPRTHISPAHVFYDASEGDPRGLAFLFAGQGSQYVGMGADLAMMFDASRAVWDEDARQAADAALHQYVFPPPVFSDEERGAQSRRLTATDVAQPALAAVALSQLALLRAVGVAPDAVCGHSFGEVLALHAAGVFDAETTLAIARRRGRVMADAAAPAAGAMLAVSADRERVAALLRDTRLPITIANHNAPRQVVLSGAASDIDRCDVLFRERQIATRRLPVASAFHSPIVSGSVDAFRQFLATVPVTPAAVPVFSNESATPYASDADEIRDRLARHIAREVRFLDSVRAMHDAGARIFLEVGPGDALTALVPQCLGQRPHVAVSLDRHHQHGVTSLWIALGRLAVAGVAMNLDALRHGTRLPRPQARPTGSHVIQVDSRLLALRALPPMPPPNAPRAAAATPAAASGAAWTHAQTPPETHAPMPRVSTPPHGAPSTTPPRYAPQHTAVDAIIREMASAQEQFMRTLSESHRAYLDLAQRALSLASDGRPDAANDLASPRLTSPEPASAVAFTPAAPVPAPTNGALALTPVSPSSALTPAPITTALSTSEIEHLLLEIVAEKTGYPVDLLELEMELEAGLGIDSIKRLEILGALRDRVPSLASITSLDPALIGEFRTLAQIAEFIDSGGVTALQAGAAASTPRFAEADAVHTALPEPVTDAVPTAISRYVLTPRPAMARGLPLRGLDTPGTIAIVPDDSELAAALAQRLAAHGFSATIASTPPADAAGAIVLGGSGYAEDADVAECSLAMHRSAFLAAKAVASAFTARGGWFVTVQDTGGDFALDADPGGRAWFAGLPAIAKTLAQCSSDVDVKAIDLARGDRSTGALADLLIEELLTGGGDIEVGLPLDGARLVPCVDRRPHADANELPCDRHSVIVVSGGARGITAACLEALAQACGPRFALLGRTPLRDEPSGLDTCASAAEVKEALIAAARDAGDSVDLAAIAAAARDVLALREIRHTLRRLSDAGSEAMYIPVDVRDRLALASALEPVRRAWGPVTGCIHAAGSLADRHIRDKSVDQFNLVFTTKVSGLASLLAVTESDPLTLLCLFSSVSSKVPLSGQIDYAAANEVMNKVARAEAARRGSACIVRSIAWGPWDGGNMVTPALRPILQARVPLIPIADGTRFFLRELSTPDTATELIVTAGDPLPSLIELTRARSTHVYAATR